MVRFNEKNPKAYANILRTVDELVIVGQSVDDDQRATMIDVVAKQDKFLDDRTGFIDDFGQTDKQFVRFTQSIYANESQIHVIINSQWLLAGWSPGVSDPADYDGVTPPEIPEGTYIVWTPSETGYELTAADIVWLFYRRA